MNELKMWKYVILLFSLNILKASSYLAKIDNLLLDTSKNTGTSNVLYGSDRIIKCYISSLVPIQIHWYHVDESSGKVTQIMASEKYSISPTGTELKIMKMNFDMVGHYFCLAAYSQKVEIVLVAPKITGKTKIRAIRGTNAVMHCKVTEGLPKPNITWEFKDKFGSKFKPIPGSGNELNLTSVTEQNGGIYKCVANNVAGTDEHVTNLIIEFPPKIISNSSVVYEGIEGDRELRIPCEAVGNPKPVITWKINDTLIIPNEKYSIQDEALVIKDLNENDSISYTCEAKNYIDSATATFIARVHTAPRITGMTEVKAIRGLIATIECSIIRGSPTPNVHWEYEDKSGSKLRTLHTSANRLILRKVGDKNAGRYTCVASNIAGRDKHVTTLIIEFPPTIISNSSVVYEGFEGDRDLRIPCEAVGNPQPVKTWKINGTLILRNKKYSIQDEALVIKDLNENDSTSYTCEAKNYIGSANATFVARVHTAPRITGMTEVKAIRGLNATIECNIVRGSPTPNVHWEYEDKSGSKLRTLHTSGNRLILRKVGDKNAGRYTCVASNIAGRDKHVTTLIIEFPPTIISNSSVVYEGFEGDRDLRIPCEAVGNPRPFNTWKIDKTVIIPSEKYSILDGALVINNLNENDAKSYTCEAKNYISSVNATFIARVHTAPKITGMTESRVIKGLNIVLDCSIIKGSPRPDISWEFKDKSGSEFMPLHRSGSRILIANVKDKNAGYYKCVANNIAGRDEHITILYIEFQPRFISKSSTVYEGLEGDIALRIPCEVVGNPQPGYTWKINGNVITPNDRYAIEDGALIIKNPTKKDSAFYTCEAKNYIGAVKQTFEATVDKFINRPERSKYIYILWHETTKLDCEGYNSTSQSVRWFKEAHEISTGKPYLEIVNPTLAGDGNYTCRVSDEHGHTSTHTYVLDVGYPPKVSDEIPVDDWRGDASDILSHCASDAKPEAKVEWEFNGKALTDKDLTKVGDYFKWGHYRCSVSNVHGEVHRNFDVKSSACFVSKKLEEIKNMPLMLTDKLTWPRWDYTEYDSIVEPGDTITLSCPYYNNDALNTFKEFPQRSELKAYCHKQDTFLVDDKMYKLTDLLCIDNIQTSVVKENKQCLTKTAELMRVGYNNIAGFIETYVVCFDHAKNMPLYTRTLITKTDGRLNTAHDWFTYSGIGNSRQKSGFTCTTCCYNKTHLVDPRNFNYEPAKKTTFINYLNVVPYWRTCENSPEQTTWEDIDSMVRDQLITYDIIIAWSGTHTFQEKHGLIVPRYLWKVLKFNDENIIAIIHVNDPAPTANDLKCKDVSQTNEIMYWFSVSNEYTYSCDLQDFIEAFDMHGINFTE